MDNEPTRNHTPSLINRAQCKRWALAYAKRENKGNLTRMGGDVYEYVEAKAREHLRMAVNASVGKTIALTTRHRNAGDHNGR